MLSALTSSAALAPLSGRSQLNGCLCEENLYIRGFPLKSTSLHKALLPLLLGLYPSAHYAFFQLLPWLALSREKETLQERQQVRERMAQLAAARSKQLIGMANVIFTCLAAQLENATLQQRQQVRERMAQLAVATSKQFIGMANVIFACLAAQPNTATARCSTEPRSRCTCSSLWSTARNTTS